MSQLIPISPTSASNFKQKLYQFTQQNPGIKYTSLDTSGVTTTNPYPGYTTSYSLKQGVIYSFSDGPISDITHVLTKIKTQTYGLKIEYKNSTITGILMDSNESTIDSISYTITQDQDIHQAMIGTAWGKLILCIDGKIMEKDTVYTGAIDISSLSITTPYKVENINYTGHLLNLYRITQAFHLTKQLNTDFTINEVVNYMKNYMIQICSGVVSPTRPYVSSIGNNCFDYILTSGLFAMATPNQYNENLITLITSASSGNMFSLYLQSAQQNKCLWNLVQNKHDIYGFKYLSQGNYIEEQPYKTSSGQTTSFSILNKQSVIRAQGQTAGIISIGSTRRGLSQLLSQYNLSSNVGEFTQPYTLQFTSVNQNPDKPRITSDTYNGYIFYKFEITSL